MARILMTSTEDIPPTVIASAVAAAFGASLKVLKIGYAGEGTDEAISARNRDYMPPTVENYRAANIWWRTYLGEVAAARGFCFVEYGPPRENTEGFVHPYAISRRGGTDVSLPSMELSFRTMGVRKMGIWSDEYSQEALYVSAVFAPDSLEAKTT